MKISAPPPAFRRFLGALATLALAIGFTAPARAETVQAPVEVRIPFAPQAVRGGDGRTHLAYELHVTNFYPGTGVLTLESVSVLGDASPAPLARYSGAQVNALLAEPAEATPAAGTPVPAGGRVVLFLWLDLPPAGAPPRTLTHQLTFRTSAGEVQTVDGVRVALDAAPPQAIGAPLRGGRWLAHEGPGNHLSHHWGGIVAANGEATIPQRFAIDWFGLDGAGHAVGIARDRIGQSRLADWAGFDAEVLAVGDGVVRDARDGVADGKPMVAPAQSDALTARTLYGNFVVIEIAPGVFAHYAHLRNGSVRVRAGDRVRRGQVIGQLGQSGNANAPHLHFHLSNAATFEQSEGLPFVLDDFSLLGSESVADMLDRTSKVDLRFRSPPRHRAEMPLDGEVIGF